jgi:pantothenate kinase type III
VKPGNIKKTSGSFVQGGGIVPGVTTRAQAISNRSQQLKELIKD